ncbi:MAG: hypothetical protein ACI9J2_002295 [Saprospiraceae bacterium]|jgi:hypothetical protein
MNKLFDGQCLCGDIQYTVSDQPIRQAQCHCTDCKKASGTGHISQVFFKEEAVSIVGKTSFFEVIANSGNANSRYFCPRCGSRLFGRNSGRPGVVGIMAGSFSDSSWFVPDVILYTKDKQVWDETSEQVPNFEAMPN